MNHQQNTLRLHPNFKK